MVFSIQDNKITFFPIGQSSELQQTHAPTCRFVFLAVGDEEVVIIAFNNAGHLRSNYFIIKFTPYLNLSQFSFSLKGSNKIQRMS